MQGLILEKKIKFQILLKTNEIKTVWKFSEGFSEEFRLKNGSIVWYRESVIYKETKDGFKITVEIFPEKEKCFLLFLKTFCEKNLDLRK